MKSIYIFIILSLCSSINYIYAELSKAFTGSEKTIFLSRIEEKKKQRSDLEKQLEQFHKEQTERIHNLQNQSIISQEIRQTKEARQTNNHNQFLIDKETLLNEIYHLLKEIEQTREAIRSIIEQHIRLLEEYIEDPELKKQEQDLLPKKTVFSFEKLQDLYERMLELTKILESLRDQEQNATIQLESRKQSAHSTILIHKEKLKLYENEENHYNQTRQQQHLQLLELEERLFSLKKQHDTLKQQEIEQKISLIQTKLFTSKLRLDSIKKIFNHIKPIIRVTRADVSSARDELSKMKQQAFLTEERYHQEIEKIKMTRSIQEKELEMLSKRYSIPIDEDLLHWNREPAQTINGYLALAQVGSIATYVTLLDCRRDLLEAQRWRDQEKIRMATLIVELKESYHKIIAGTLHSSDDINSEIRRYTRPRAEAQAALSHFKERIDAVSDLLHIQKRASENIQKIINTLEEKKESLFRSHATSYINIQNLLQNTERKIQNQIDLSSKMISVYNDSISLIERTQKQMNFVIAELNNITIWYRPERAISLTGIKNIIPDIQQFFHDVKLNISEISTHVIVQAIQDLFHDWTAILCFFMHIFILFFIIGFLRIAIPLIKEWVFSWKVLPVSLRTFNIFFTILLNFFEQYFVSITLWLISFWLLNYYAVHYVFIHICFYLISIPYLLYIARTYIQYLQHTQELTPLISDDFKERLLTSISFILYATITIFFFKQAFVMGNYRKSELPTILLAINTIIFQICLIILISKEPIIDILPNSNETWFWIRQQVDRFFHLFLFLLLATIIMINPYVGFGTLIWYIVQRCLYTAIFLVLLYWIHVLIKRWSSSLFFASQDDLARERFSYAKTWYGTFVILLFLTFLGIGALILAKIWRWPESLYLIQGWNDLVEWARLPILLEKTESPISIASVLQIFSFIVLGTLVAFAINRFVLQRIYDILLVESGIQNTISSFIRYTIIGSSVVLGFQAVGLHSLITFVAGAIILGIGWMIKEPIGDFIAYFIILVQRPIKIGDYVKFDEEHQGVVRKITPRSIVMRKKNSTTIIIPNTKAISQAITNWNYVRGFIACNDISIVISYKYNPERIIAIFYQVLDENQYILKNPKPIIRLDEFGEYGFIFMIRGFISSNYTLDMWEITSDLRIGIVKKLRSHNIGLAVPIRYVYRKIVTDHTGEGDLISEPEGL